MPMPMSPFVDANGVGEVQRMTFNMPYGHPTLDAGERDLLIYAETLAAPVWLLNSPAWPPYVLPTASAGSIGWFPLVR